MRLPKQSAPVTRRDIFGPSDNSKDIFVIGIEPNDPASFGQEIPSGAICQILSPYAVAECMNARGA